MQTTSLSQFIALLPVLIPIFIAYFALMVYCLIDLLRADRRVRGGNKWVWAIVVLFIGTFGPLAYLFFGREDM